MESLKVIKELGHGVIGTTYLVEIDKKKYIAKIEKINEKDIKYDTSKSLWREIEFSKFASKYPEHFMTLKSFEIINLCEHKQPDPPSFIQGIRREDLINQNKSTFCSKLVYSPVLDHTWGEYVNELNLKKNIKKLYSMMCQCIYSIGLLNKNGYIHRDIHNGNIMYKKTNKKNIELESYKVPTYGKQWYIIDYGLIVRKDFKRTHGIYRKSEIRKLQNMHLDIIQFIEWTIYMPIWKEIEKR